MEAMFSKMMEGCIKGMSDEDKKKMMACGEKMVAVCPCMTTGSNSETDKKAMAEKMMSMCGGMMQMMPAFFKTKTPQETESGK
ncbi:MAG: hypothetical protein ABSB79_14440 [Syntrophales bacterium]|jgi:hypothetical protein